MKNPKYDIALVILGAMVAFFIGIASTAFYDLFRDLVQEFSSSKNVLRTFQALFTIVPLCIAAFLFRDILRDHL
jgi:ABC-type enterochelin transport system permease subunit